jgi:hypothetical protein
VIKLIRNRRTRILAIVFLLTVGALSILALSQRPKRSTRINERWETGNGKFDIRVTAYAEDNGGFVAGAYYIFESRQIRSGDWHQVMKFRHDDPVPVPRDQIRFVNGQIAFVFMGWMYAVTTDGAKNWSVWNAEQDLPNWQCCNYRLIADVTITENGNGVMRLSPIKDRRGEVPELRTDDYGKHWRVE